MNICSCGGYTSKCSYKLENSCYLRQQRHAAEDTETTGTAKTTYGPVKQPHGIATICVLLKTH